MGHGIAATLSLRGLDVCLTDINEEILKVALKKIRDDLDLLVKMKVASTDEADAALSRITPTTDLSEAVRTADFISECVTETMKVKIPVLAEVEKSCPKHAIISSNTSSIRLRDLAEGLKNPERLIGVHWMLPPQIRPIVEIIPSKYTLPETVEMVKAFVRLIDKTPVIAPDTPGFLVNRLQAGVFMTAFQLLQEGADKADIDACWTQHLGLRYCLMGPIEAADSMGLDVMYISSAYFADALGDPRMKAPDVVKARFEAGEYGYKTGKGFYDYSGVKVQDLVDRRNRELFDLIKWKEAIKGKY